MMLPILIIMLVFTVKYSLFNPTKMVIYYIIISSYFFGFFNPGLIIIGGTELGMFSVNFFLFIAIFLYKRWYLIDMYIAPIMLTLFILLFYGILGPVFREFENLQQAVTSSKSFLHVAIFFYIFIRREDIDVYVIMRFMRRLGLYLGILSTLSILVPPLMAVMPPAYTMGFGTGGMGGIFVQYPTYIVLAQFLYYAEWQSGNLKTKPFLYITLILFLGTMFTKFTALTTFSYASLAFIYTVWHSSGIRESFTTIKKVLSVLLLMIVVYVASVKLQETLAEEYHKITSGEDLALKTRDIYNAFRWKAIYDSPLIGMGFIHKSAPIMDNYKVLDNPYMEKFDVIDSGYVDQLVRFGYIGVIVYLTIVGLYLLSVFKQEDPSPYALAAAAYILPYFLINTTWAVFSFPHGLIPMSIAFFVIYSFRPTIKYYKLYR